MATINMQTMRYINLLDSTSKVKTRKCFVFNNTIIFAVPGMLLSKAIGNEANNIKKLNQKLGKRIKIIKEVRDAEDAKRFISEIVSPIKFKSIEVREGVMVIGSGGTQNKAALIGRDKKRLIELERIIKDVFGLELRIV